MTPIALLEALATFLRETVKDVILPVRAEDDEKIEDRAAEVYVLSLPDREAITGNVPYIVLQVPNGSASTQENTCAVRAVIAIYHDDMQNGNYQLLSLITRIMTALIKAGVIDNRYILCNEPPIEYLIYNEELPPFYIGEMMITFKLPLISREIKSDWRGDIF